MEPLVNESPRMASQRPGRTATRRDLSTADDAVRAFIGYSGWSQGQLENELRGQSWFPTLPQPDLLGNNHDASLWGELLRRLSPLHRILAEAPEDPRLN